MTVTDPSWAAAQTVHRLFHCIDGGKMDAAAALFAPDGYWVRGGEKLVGPDGVLRALIARPQNLSTRHIASNMVLDQTDTGYVARYYITVFAHEGETAGPAPLTTPMSIFACEDELIGSTAAWLFKSRTPKLVFKRA